MQTLMQDLRYGARMLRKNYGFTAIAALSVALGIGANTALFSVVNAVLLKQLPVKEPERLVMFESLVPAGFRYGAYSGNTHTDPATGLQAGTSFPHQTYVRLRAQESVLSEVFAFSGAYESVNVSVDGQAEVVRGQLISGNYYSGLGVAPFLGRMITDEDDRGGASPVAVLNHRYWQRRFGGAPAAVGRQININNLAFTIIGVAPPGFEGTGQVGSSPEVMMPLAMESQVNPQRARLAGAGMWWLRLMGRLKPGATAEQARAQLEGVFQQSMVEHREARRSQAQSQGGRPVPPLEPKDYPRLGVNSGSQGEMEGMRALAPQLDPRVFGFALALSLVTGLLFGCAPALRATRIDLTPSLKEGAKSSSGVSRSALSKSLVVAQVAMSLVLLVGAGLVVRTLRNLQSVDAGFNRDNLLLFTVEPNQLGYRGDRLASLYRRMFEGLEAVPGARAVTCSMESLLSGSSSGMNIFLAGSTFATGPDNQPVANGNTRILVSRENYLEAMEIPLLLGRALGAQDDERAPRVAVVNQAFAKQFFPNESPLGKRFGFSAETANQMEIIGVARDTKYTSLREEVRPNAYIPWAQELRFAGRMTFALRASGDPAALVSAVREAMRGVDGNLPLSDVKTQVEQAEQSLRMERLFARLLSFFGLLALLLAGVGLYGVLAYAVAQRTREIGIRLALGAQTGDVLKLVIWQGMVLALAGVALGVGGAIGLTRLLRSLLFGVSATDPLTFVMIASLLTTVALLACWIPARRAAKVDPMVALRNE